MSDDNETLPPDTAFDRYVIVRRIGAGGMGAVYEARHTDLQKRVALKVLHNSVASNAEVRARFLREGQAATRIRHPHVVDVSDVGISNGVPYMVMEFLEGEDLSQAIERQGPLSVEQVIAVMLPVASAVAAAHDAGIVHRDLKPENIFLAKGRHGGSNPKLLDFGISKITDGQSDMQLTGTGLLMGTPYYMSPEQARGGKAVGPRSDLYGLGVILYQSLTARKPFDGETLFAVLDGIVNGRFTPLSEIRGDVPGALEYVIHRAMDKDPDARYQTAAALGRALLPFGSASTRAMWESEFGVPAQSGDDMAYQATEMSFGPADASSRVAALAALSAPASPTGTFSVPSNTLHQGATEVPVRQTLPPGRGGRMPVWAIGGALLVVGAIGATWAITRGHRADDSASMARTRPGTPLPVPAAPVVAPRAIAPGPPVAAPVPPAVVAPLVVAPLPLVAAPVPPPVVAPTPVPLVAPVPVVAPVPLPPHTTGPPQVARHPAGEPATPRRPATVRHSNVGANGAPIVD